MEINNSTFSPHPPPPPPTKTWPRPRPPPATTPTTHYNNIHTTLIPNKCHTTTTMLGLHNILLIAPQPNLSSNQGYTNFNNNNYDSMHWSLNNKSQEREQRKKDVLLSTEDHDHLKSCFKICSDCGNRAKKECLHGRCRSCCNSRGYDCPTHVKSTWVSAARRKEKQVVSGSFSCGTKRPRVAVSTSKASTSNAANFNFDTGSSHQYASFKESFPGEVRAPAVFRCIRVTAISDGEAEIGYQATVNISGRVFKGFLYDHGVDEKNLFPCISKLHLESTDSGRKRELFFSNRQST